MSGAVTFYQDKNSTSPPAFGYSAVPDERSSDLQLAVLFNIIYLAYLCFVTSPIHILAAHMGRELQTHLCLTTLFSTAAQHLMRFVWLCSR